MIRGLSMEGRWGEWPWFAVRFVLAGGLMLAIVGQYSDSSPAFAALSHAYARITAAVLGLAGLDVRVAGDTVFQPSGFAIKVTAACTAVLPTVLFVAALVALRAPWRLKIPACAAGLLLIHLANLVRLIAVFVVGVYARDWFDFTHDVLGELLLIGATVAAWLAAVRVIAYIGGRSIEPREKSGKDSGSALAADPGDVVLAVRAAGHRDGFG
jgi:exosortase/archaeosortase family protein